MPVRDAALAVLVMVIWGMNFVVIDEGLAGVPPLLFLAIRFVVVLLPAIFLIRRPAVPWRTLATIGLMMSAGQFGLLYSALALGMPAGLASLVLQVQVMFTVLLAAVKLQERPTRRQSAGIAIGAGGLILVAFGRSDATPLIGLLLTIGAGFSWACGNVASRKAAVASGLSMTVWSALFVPLPLLALSVLIDGPAEIGRALTQLSPGNVASTAYTAYLATLVGYGIFNTLLARHQASLVAPFTLLVPPVGLLTASVVQHEAPGPLEITGSVIMLAGVAITAIRSARARTGNPSQQPPSSHVRGSSSLVAGHDTKSLVATPADHPA